MRERGWSRVRLFEEIGAELGYAPKSRSGFLPLLVNREPTPAQAIVLRRHFGEPPEEATPMSSPVAATPPGLDALLVKLDHQAEAITRLVEVIGAASASREALEARVRAMESELQSLRAQRGDGASSAPPVPRTSEG